MKCRSTEVQTWGTHRTDRAQTKKVGGHWVPQLRSLPAILARGLRIRPAHSRVPPTLMRCRCEAHTTQTAHRHWWRAAGSTTPQLPECAEDGYPGKGPPCARPAHSPVPPTLTRPVGKSVAGLLNSSRSWAACPTV